MKTLKYLLGGVLLLAVAASCNTNDSNRKKEISTREVADINTPESNVQQEQLVEEHVLLAEAYVVRRAKKATEQVSIAPAVPESNLAVMEEGMASELEKGITVIGRIKRERIELVDTDEPVVAIGEPQLANVEAWRGETEVNVQESGKLPEGEYDINMANLQGKFNIGEFENIVQGIVAVGKWEFIDRDSKEIWRTELADGSHLSYKLKDGEYKDVFKEHDRNSRDFIKEKETANKYVEKVKEDGHRKVRKVKNKGDEIVIKEKYNGIKSVERSSV